MGGGLAGRCPTLKPAVGGAIANYVQERFVANCSELKDRHSEPRDRHCERSEAIHPSACEVTMDCFASLAMTVKYRSATTTVVPREGGVSSTPRPIVSITAASGILDRPPSRTMTVECVSAFSRRIAPEVCLNVVPQSKRAQGMPGACCTRDLVCK